MKKKITAVLLLLLIVFCLSGTVFMLTTTAGLNFLADMAQRVSGGQLHISDVDGRVWGDASVSGISLQLDSGELQLAQIRLRWHPGELLRGRLHVHLLQVDGLSWQGAKDTKDDGAKTTDGITLPQITLPFEFVVDEAHLTNLKLLQGEGPFRNIDDLSLAGSLDGEGLHLTRFRLDDDDGRFDLEGSLQMRGDWPLSLAGTWELMLPGREDVKGRLEASESLRNGKLGLQVQMPFSAEVVTDFSLGTAIRWASQLTINDLDLSLVSPDVAGLLSAKAQLSGTLEEEGVRAQLQLETVSGQIQDIPVSLHGSASFDGNEVNVTALQALAGGVELTAQGRVGEQLNVSCKLASGSGQTLLPSLDGVLQADAELYGPLRAPSITLKLNGQGIGLGGAEADRVLVTADGQLAVDGLMHAEARMEGLRYGEEDDGELDLIYDGSFASHSLHATYQRPDVKGVLTLAGAYRSGTWKGQINELDLRHGERDHLQLKKPAILTAGKAGGEVKDFCLLHRAGGLCLDGKLEDGLWQAQLALEHFNPGPFASSYQGDINAHLEAGGNLKEKEAQVNLKDVSGSLRDMLLKGGGRFSMDHEKMSFGDIALQLGEAHVAAQGQLGNQNALKFSLDIPDLKQIIPSEAAGTLALTGAIGGEMSHPFLTLDVKAESLLFATASVDQLAGKVGVDLREKGQVNINLKGAGIDIESNRIANLSLVANGTAEAHTFSLEVDGDRGDFTLSGEAGYGEEWVGKVTKMRAVGTMLGDIHSVSQPDFSFSDKGFFLSSLCLSGKGLDVCVDGNFSGKDTFAAHGELQQFDTSVLSLPALFSEINGRVTGRVELSSDADHGLTGTGLVSSDKINMAADIQGDHLTYSLSDTEVKAQLSDGKAELALNSTLQKQGHLQGNLQMSLKGTPDQRELAGDLAVDIDDLSMLALLSDGRVSASGNLLANIHFAGTQALPVLQGDLLLAGGNLSLADLGITVTDLTANLTATGDQTQFSFSGHSGEGQLTGTGDFSVGPGKPWRVSMQAIAKDFDLMGTEQVQLTVDSTLSLECDSGGGRLDGDLTIGKGHIRMGQSSSVIGPSGDVVIVSGQEEKAVWQIQTHLLLHFGDKVFFTGYGLDGRLQGDLVYEDTREKMSAATGEISLVEGTYALYTAKLAIDRGRVLFAGGSIDNPGIDVRATRKVDDVTAGVMVSGTLDDMQIQLFSDPTMEETNILAYLMVGKPLSSSEENEQNTIKSAASAIGLAGLGTFTEGLGRYVPIDEIHLDGSTETEDMSLVVGKNITDDLFIGYDHNFYDDTGKFKIRYRLGHGFSIETESSADATGGDLTYSIER